MTDFKPEKFEYEQTDKDESNGTKTHSKKWSLDTEDIVALGGVVVAILTAIGMIIGLLPINNYTYGLAGLAAVTAGIAKFVTKGDRKK
jgi:hypothetical protein